MSAIAKKIFKDALEIVAKTKRCGTCQFSKLCMETGEGYCEFSGSGYISGHPLYINEDYVCKHWKKRINEQRNNRSSNTPTIRTTKGRKTKPGGT